VPGTTSPVSVVLAVSASAVAEAGAWPMCRSAFAERVYRPAGPLV
jgi:hypothetical protein